MIDGEGCISIDKKHTIRVDVGMSAKALPALRWLESRYQGSVRQTRESTEKWEAAWCWTLIGRKVEDFLRAIKPHLLLKAEQAGIALEMQALRRSMPTTPGGRMRWTDDGRTAAERLRLLMQDANRKGPQHSPTLAGERIALLVGERWVSLQTNLLDGAGLTSYRQTWPRAGMTRNGIAFQRRPLAPLTAATASGSLPTPTARDHKDTGDLSNVPENGLLPRVVQRMERDWPTPTARLGTARGPQAKRYHDPARSNDLDDAVAATPPEQQFPTPTANRWDGLQSHGRNVVSGSLNPTWVEWLMGFPLGWTDCGR